MKQPLFLPSALLLVLLLDTMAKSQEKTPSPASPAQQSQGRQLINQDDEKGTYLGLLFGPIGEALYEQLPQIPRNQGVLVTHVLPDSPAAQTNLRRHDILLQYQQEKIRDCDHLVRLIQKDKPNNKIRLTVLRAGKPVEVETTLGLGPVLRIASIKNAIEQNRYSSRTNNSANAPGIAKPAGSPATVTVSATPLEPGKMKVAIEFYQEGTGRLRTVVCQGTDEIIDDEVKKLPERERLLVNTALRRLRDLNLRQMPQAPQEPKE